jgi:hypothetical protein
MTAVGKRADFFSLKVMPETTFGVDPGITTVSYVDGVSEPYAYQANDTFAQFVRLAEKPSGLPKLPMVEVPQVFNTHDFDTLKVKGIRGDAGEFQITINMNGTTTDYGTTGNTGRTQPPVWLRLAASACGSLLGNLTGGPGGSATTVASATDADTFVATAGTVQPGYVVAVDGPNAATSFEIIRPTLAAGSTITKAAYDGVNWGLSTTPAAADPLYYACQSAYDKRLEDVSESFAMLIMRPNGAASVKLLGCRCKAWEITSKVGTIPVIKLTFLYNDFDYVTKTIDDEPAYIEDFIPCAHVSYGASLWLTWDVNDDGNIDAATDRKTNLDVSSMTIKWEAGYVRRKSLTASSGITEILASQPGKFEMSFECIYDQQWQDYLGLCSTDNFGNLTVMYWEPQEDYVRSSASALRKGAWFVCVPQAHQMEDPGSEGAVDEVMSQTIRLGAGDWTGDGSGVSTTVAVLSDNVNISTFAGAGTLNVASTTGFPASGSLLVQTDVGAFVITYTGVGATTFTGCDASGQAGDMSTGFFVNATAVFATTKHIDTIFQLGVV